MGRRSIGAAMTLYNVILLSLLAIALVTSMVAGRAYSHEYNRNADLYREVSVFYRTMQQARGAAQSYFYDMTDDNLKAYYRSIAQAEAMLDSIMQNANDVYIRFRFNILRNMLESCNEQFQKVHSSWERPIYTDEYARIYYLFDLTDSTQREYYSYLVQYTDERHQALQQIWQRNTLIVTIIVMIIALTATVFSFSASRWLTKPITSIVQNIQKIKKGEYDLSQVKDSGPEFAVLGEAFDDMAASIRSNINSIETNARLRRQLLEAENENLRMNEQLINSELKILQAQMNPHFLFNTLSMISQIASMEQAEEASRLIDITTDLLRYSMDKSNRMSTLQEEIACAENYISIQRLRLGERITFELTAAKNLPNIMLPGMLLQPLIENSCVHGVAEMLKGAVVTVTAGSRNGALFLSVEDNGKGISAERLEEIISGQSGERHIGLVNAKRRIEMLYGDSATFHIESTEDVGTLVSITIAQGSEHV